MSDERKIIPRAELLAEGESPDLLTALALTSQLRGQGSKPSEDPTLEFARELTEGDLALLAQVDAGAQLVPASHLTGYISHRHHLAARMIAEGAKGTEVAYATGYTPGRISALKGDAEFQELVAYYAQRAEKSYLDVHQRLGTLGMLAVDRLMQRLGDDASADTLSAKTLREVAEMALDRSLAPSKRAGATQLSINPGAQGAGSGLNININFGDAPGVPAAPGGTLDLTATDVTPKVELPDDE